MFGGMLIGQDHPADGQDFPDNVREEAWCPLCR